MITIEFHTRIDNGSIVIPEQFREQIRGSVHVTVEVEEVEASEEDDFITYLMRNPLYIPDFKPLPETKSMTAPNGTARPAGG